MGSLFLCWGGRAKEREKKWYQFCKEKLKRKRRIVVGGREAGDLRREGPKTKTTIVLGNRGGGCSTRRKDSGHGKGENLLIPPRSGNKKKSLREEGRRHV